MDRVLFGRKWVIKTEDDVKMAREVLDGNEFIAHMSDDYHWYDEEMTEINRQRASVAEQARALGLA